MLGMHPLSAYFGTSPDLGELSVASKYVTMLAGAERVTDPKTGREKITPGLGLHVMLCKPGTKEPYDIRTDREKESDQEEWTAYRQALIDSGQTPPRQEQHPGGLYVATNNVKRLQKYLKAANAVTEAARGELNLLTTRHLFATVLADGADTSQVAPEQLEDLRDQYAQLASEVAEIEEAKPRKNTKAYRRLTMIKPLVDKSPLAEHDHARIRSLEEQLRFPHPNLAVSVGPSNVVVVDCDTAKEVEAFQRWAARLSGDDNWLRTKPTVSSPGVHRDGTWKHKDGGHFWFMLPRPVAAVQQETPQQGNGGYTDTRRVLHHDSAMGVPAAPVVMEPIPEQIATVVTVEDDIDPSVKFSIFVNKSYVLIPPSVRPEGGYLSPGPSHDMPEWLYSYIMGVGHRRAERAEERRLWREGRGPLPDHVAQDIQNWYEEVSWEDLLAPIGWTETGTDSCGCPIWRRPGGASYKSATTHQPGCSQHVGSVDPPIHFWTSDPGTEIANKLQSLGAVPGAGSGSLSKLQLAAALYFGGDDGEAMKYALGEAFSGTKVSYEFYDLFPGRNPGLYTVRTIAEVLDPDEITDEDSDIELMALPSARVSGASQQAQIDAAAEAHLNHLAQQTGAPAPATGYAPTQDYGYGMEQPQQGMNPDYGTGVQSPQQGMSPDYGTGVQQGMGGGMSPHTGGGLSPDYGTGLSPDYGTGVGAGGQDVWAGSAGTAAMAAGQPAPSPEWPQVTGQVSPQDGNAAPAGFGHPQQGQGAAPQPTPQPVGAGGVPMLPTPAKNPFGPVESDKPQLPRNNLHPAPGSDMTQGFGPAGSGVGHSPQFPGQESAALGAPTGFTSNPFTASLSGGTAPAASDFSLFQGVDGYVDTTGGGADEDGGYDGSTLPPLKQAPFFFKHNVESETAPPFKSLDTLMAELPPVEFLIKSGRNGIIQDRALTVVAGPSNAGKSAVLLDMLCTMAAEQTPEDGKFGVWMNAMTKRRNILYVAGEGIAGVVNRVAAWEVTHNRSVRQHMSFTDEAFPFNAPETAWQDLANRIINGGYQVIVFDTMATMMTGLEENSNDDMGRVMSWLHRLVDRTRAAVILVHHTGKSAENMTPRGASALTAAISSQLLVQKREMSDLDKETQERFERDGITPIRVSVTKQKDSGYADPLDLSLVRVKVPSRPGLPETDDFDQDYGHQTVLVGDNTGKIPTRDSAPPVVNSTATPRGFVSDTKDLALKIISRVVAVGAGPEDMRQTSELSKAKLHAYLSAQWGRDYMEPIPAAQFRFEFANAVTLAINAGALREDGTLLHPNVHAYARRDRDKALEILTSKINGASADDVSQAQALPTSGEQEGEGSDGQDAPTAPAEESAPDNGDATATSGDRTADEAVYGLPEDDFDPSIYDVTDEDDE